MRSALAPALAVALGLTAASATPATAGGATADSVAWRIEAGASSEYTNELFFEDALVDTTFLGRRLVESPEARGAAVLAVAARGTRGGGVARWDVANELSIGNLVQRNALSGAWRSEATPEWLWSAAPRVEWRRDRSLGRDLTEWRAQVRARVRRGFLASFRTAEAGVTSDLLRAEGTGSELLLDRQAAGVFAAFGQNAPGAPDLWAGWASTARWFPDSLERDHWEHRGELRARWDAGGDAVLALELEGVRRATRRTARTSRDDFLEGRAGLEAGLRPVTGLGAWLRAEAEMQRFDLEDTTLFFDHHVLRATAGPRWSGPGGLDVWLAARVERLAARLAPGESYVEAAAIAEVELLAGGWWSVTPAGGRREYGDDPQSAALGLPQLRSAYRFAELTLLAEQPLAGGVRARALATGRVEWHEDGSQDARSLYISVDVRKLF